MQRIQDSGRTATLVLELSSGTAILHGEEVELPFREFRLLAELAARVGDPVPSSDLIEAVWPDEPWTPKENLYILVTRLRRLVDGETQFGKNIRNRRGYGYVLDLDPDEVAVTETRRERPDPAPAPLTTEAAEAGPYASEHPVEEEGTRSLHPVSRDRRPLLRIALASGLSALLIAGSWAAGYIVSDIQADETRSGTAGGQTTSEPEASADQRAPRRGDRGRSEPKSPDNRQKDRKRGGSRNAAGGAPAPPPAGAVAVAPNVAGPPTSTQGSSKGSAEKKEPAPPQLPPAPTRYLYHLVNPETGDHFVTTDGGTASSYEGKGYTGGAIGGIYTSPPQGVETKSISTNHGTGYIFAGSSPRTEPASRAIPLYYSSNGKGDFFYTTDSGEANRSGWSGNLIGYVRGL